MDQSRKLPLGAPVSPSGGGMASISPLGYLQARRSLGSFPLGDSTTGGPRTSSRLSPEGDARPMIRSISNETLTDMTRPRSRLSSFFNADKGSDESPRDTRPPSPLQNEAPRPEPESVAASPKPEKQAEKEMAEAEGEKKKLEGQLPAKPSMAGLSVLLKVRKARGAIGSGRSFTTGTREMFNRILSASAPGTPTKGSCTDSKVVLGGCVGPMCATCTAEVGWKGIIPRKEAEIVAKSWEGMFAKHTYAEMAEAFFDTLFAAHPQVENLFYRACAGAQMFQSMTTKLRELMLDKEAGSADLDLIGVRHLRYNVKMNLFPRVGKELLNVLEELSDPGTFTEPVKEAWLLLWTNTSKLFSKYLDVDPVVRAIARGALDDLKSKLDITPRGFRTKRLLQKLADGQTPLLRGIRTRKMNIIKYMLHDILEIRSDRSGYYYGREELFKVHSDIVNELTEHAPEALSELLDGCKWESNNIDNGVRRVNYYLAGLYGHPNVHVMQTPLAILLTLKTDDIFTHPVIITLIEKKWVQFGRKKFFIEQFFALLKLVIFINAYLTLQHASVMVRLVMHAVVWILGLRDIYISCRLLGFFDIEALRQVVGKERNYGVLLKRFTSFVMEVKWVRLVPDLLIMAMIPFDSLWQKEKKPGEVEDVLTGVVIVCLCMQLLRAFLASKELSAFTHTISRMVVDVCQFFCVFTFVWVAFGMSFYIMLGTRGAIEFLDVWTSMLSLFGMVFGFYEYEFRQKRDLVGLVATLMWLLYLIFVILLMINLLIAQFSSSYNVVKDAAYAVTMRKMAEEIVTMENTLSRRKRQEMWNDMSFDKPLEFDEGDPGPNGGIQVLEKIQSLQPGMGDRILRFRGRADPDSPWPSVQPKDGLSGLGSRGNGSDTGDASFANSVVGSKCSTPSRVSPRSSMSAPALGELPPPKPSVAPKVMDMRRQVVNKAANIAEKGENIDLDITAKPQSQIRSRLSGPGAVQPATVSTAAAPGIPPNTLLGAKPSFGGMSPLAGSSLMSTPIARSLGNTPTAGTGKNSPTKTPTLEEESEVASAEDYDDIPMATITRGKFVKGGDSGKPFDPDNITLDELAKHCEDNDAWIAIHGEVYNVTAFVPLHPGGEAIMTAAGSDGTDQYDDIGHSKYADALMKNYRIGKLAPENS